MKYFIILSISFFLLLASRELVNAKINTSFSDVNTETYYTSLAVDNSKATLSNDLKMSYERTSDQLKAPIGILADNWGNILLALLALSEIITRLVPSVKDNSIFNFFIRILNTVVPNKQSGGGTF